MLLETHRSYTRHFVKADVVKADCFWTLCSRERDVDEWTPARFWLRQWLGTLRVVSTSGTMFDPFVVGRRGREYGVGGFNRTVQKLNARS